jgi:hypothetical protein
VLVMNDLRILRLKWKMLKVNDDSQTSSPEDLLCSTFATKNSTEGIEMIPLQGISLALQIAKKYADESGERRQIAIYTDNQAAI